MPENEKMSLNATWSMAVGGMVGGGIFSVLGVVIGSAAQWAWLSFTIAGMIALMSAYSYSCLSLKYQKNGGVYDFLKEIGHKGLAASLSWVLILGYVLTISVYAFTFGHYVAHVFNWGSWFPRALAFVAIAILALVNLRGVGDSSRVEIITVWGNLFILLGLAVFGLTDWDKAQLTEGVQSKEWYHAMIGAATIFMAYEGFQLLSYDYTDIRNRRKNLPRVLISAVIAVTLIYIVVPLGSTMIVGADKLVQQKETALLAVGKKAFGITGLVLVVIAAAFSTGSAINATLFSTGRLMEKVSKGKDLPPVFSKENNSNIAYYSILGIAGVAAVLSVIGSLGSLVDAASLIFLITFGTVNLIAFKEKAGFRFIPLLGVIMCGIAIVVSAWKQFTEHPVPLIVIVVLIACSVLFRKFILRKIHAVSRD